MPIRIILFFLFLLAFPELKAKDHPVSLDTIRVVVRGISIEGNKRTKEFIILRELPFKVGDTLRLSDLSNLKTTAKNQLTTVALFHDIWIDDSISGNNIYYSITVRERWYIFPDPTFAIADRNFNEWWKTKSIYRTTYGVSIYDLNFRGRNERLSISLIDGWHKLIGLQYKIPYLNKAKTLGMQLTSQYEVGHEVPFMTYQDHLQFLRVDSRYIYHKANADLQFIYRRKLRVTHTLAIGFENYIIDDTISRVRNTEYISTGKTTLFAPYASYRITYQNLDYFFYPTKGFFISSAVEKKGLPGMDLNTLNFYLDVEKYTTIMPLLSLANSFKLQQSPNKDLPYIYSNALGYRDLVRGYEHYVVNGSGYFVLNNEVRRKIADWKIRMPYYIPSQFNPAPLKIYLKAYYDVGYVNSPPNTNMNVLPNHTLQGYGAGLDFISFYDSILRIEYSFNNLGQNELFLHYLAAF